MSTSKDQTFVPLFSIPFASEELGKAGLAVSLRESNRLICRVSASSGDLRSISLGLLMRYITKRANSRIAKPMAAIRMSTTANEV